MIIKLINSNLKLVWNRRKVIFLGAFFAFIFGTFYAKIFKSRYEYSITIRLGQVNKLLLEKPTEAALFITNTARLNEILIQLGVNQIKRTKEVKDYIRIPVQPNPDCLEFISIANTEENARKIGLALANSLVERHEKLFNDSISILNQNIKFYEESLSELKKQQKTTNIGYRNEKNSNGERLFTFTTRSLQDNLDDLHQKLSDAQTALLGTFSWKSYINQSDEKASLQINPFKNGILFSAVIFIVLVVLSLNIPI